MTLLQPFAELYIIMVVMGAPCYVPFVQWEQRLSIAAFESAKVDGRKPNP